MDYSDTGAIITGGASGLGAATATLLAAQGAKVTIFDMNVEAGQALADTIGGRFAKVDVTDETNVEAELDLAERARGVARIIVSCAGIGPAAKTVGREAKPHAMDVFRKTIEVNLIGTFLMLSRAAARMIAADPVGEERGVIVNTASVAAYDGQIGQVAYSASKGGIVGMTLPIARDLAQYGIRVMTVAPGLFLTPLLMTVSEEMRASLGAQVPFPARLGDPSEYALLVDSIVRNPMLNGEVIRLDGAIRMAPR